jgi:hypothetical protein
VFAFLAFRYMVTGPGDAQLGAVNRNAPVPIMGGLRRHLNQHGGRIVTVETTQKTMELWFNGDVAALSDDVVFEDMGNHMGRGREFRGRDAVGAWSNWLWSEPFEATPELVKMIVADDSAVLEFTIAGIHKGESPASPVPARMCGSRCASLTT